jgi:acetolactate synthase-1/3 small subunit
VSKFTIVVFTTPKWVYNIVGQIEKQIEVIKVFSHTDEETIYQESALFKVASHLLFDEREIQNIIKDTNAQIVTVSREFFVISKSGRRSEIDMLYDLLKPFGIMQFVRSGRIAVSKAEMQISLLLKGY